ncbi:MAG: hypothetical protein J0L65_12435 [Xanthomonadales bacterium]|nr:hypothetical protein [Xanthomonadales bacterium]
MSNPLESLLSREAATNENAAPPPVLLGYQQRWVADQSPLKLAEKSRRIGLTWGEAADDVLIASGSDGSNVFYISATQDMALEYIEACAMWARAFDLAAGQIEEGIFLDDGDKEIKLYKIDFPKSGKRIVALSSRPANLRGKQGVVVIDEAAFHGQLDELLKAALALLIWGGRVRVISTHDGDMNPFAELVNEIRSGKRLGSVHRIDFQQAVAEGLYRRVCLRLRKIWDAVSETAWVKSVYAFYGEAATEELDVIPSQGTGAWLTSALIEARMYDAPVLRFTAPRGFEQRADRDRWQAVQDWLETAVEPHVRGLDSQLDSVFGQDFGRSGDLTVMVPAQIRQNLTRRVPFTLELRNVPHRQQEQIANFVLDQLPRFRKAAVDARGNGHALAEFLAQKYGYERVELVMLSETWYREQMPPLKTAFEDGLIELPRDKDTLADLRAIKVVRGVARVPDSKSQGTDGGQRHGDAGIAIALMHYASRLEFGEIAFASTGLRSSMSMDGDLHASGPDFRDTGFGTVAGGNDFAGYV